MLRMMLNSKIHRAVVTEADLNYVGSITIDQNLLDAVGMLPNEKVHIVNNNNGARFETYIISGERGSGVICVNGAALVLNCLKADIECCLSITTLSSTNLQHLHTPEIGHSGRRMKKPRPFLAGL